MTSNSSITRNKIGPDGAKAIAEALKTNTTLKVLDLGVIEIDSISCFLTSNSPITGNSIGPDGVRAIADVLKTNTSLTKLFIWVS